MTDQQKDMLDALEIFIQHFKKFIVSQLEKVSPGNWVIEFENAINKPTKNGKNKKYENWMDGKIGKSETELIDLIDFQYLEIFANNRKEFLRRVFDNDAYYLPTWLHEIANVRHKIVHFNKKLKNDEMTVAWIQMGKIAEHIQDLDLQNGLKEIKDRNSQKKNELIEKPSLEGQREKTNIILITSLISLGGLVVIYFLFSNVILRSEPPPAMNVEKPVVPSDSSNNSTNNSPFLYPKKQIETPELKRDKPNEIATITKEENVTKEDYTSFINNKEKVNVSVLILDAQENTENSMANSIVSIYSNLGKKVNSGLIKNSFIAKPEFRDLLEGNSDIIEKLNLTQYADYLALGKIKYDFQFGSLVSGTTVCTASIEMSIINTSTKSTNHFDFSETGNGQNEMQAKNDARKKLISRYFSDYSNL